MHTLVDLKKQKLLSKTSIIVANLRSQSAIFRHGVLSPLTSKHNLRKGLGMWPVLQLQPCNFIQCDSCE